MEHFSDTLIAAVDDTNADFKNLAAEFLNGNGDCGFNNRVVVAANDFDVLVIEFLAGEGKVGGAQRRFHHAAGASEDRAGARIDLKRMCFAVTLAGLRHKERVDALATEKFGKVARRERGVNILEGRRVSRDFLVLNEPTPGGIHFGTGSLEDLGRAGRHRNKVDLAGIALENVLGCPRLRERTTHLQRGFRGGKVGEHVGRISFGVLHPARAARCEMRERVFTLLVDFRPTFAEYPVLHLLHEFGAFFDNRLVRGAVAVVRDAAEGFQSVDHLLGREFTGFPTEFFADRYAHGRRRLGNHDAVLSVKDAFDFINEAHLLNGIERAGHKALAAIKARIVNDLVFGAETTFP